MAKTKVPVKDDLRTLSGAERAAVIMLSLGEDHSERLWQLVDEEEIKEISQVMSNLGSISAGLVEKLLVDFVGQMSGTGALMGSYESTERLLSGILPPEKVGSIMEEIRGPAGRTMWDKLANVNETVLANYLKNEYPQTVSVVLSKIKPEHAARVLGALPEEFALEVVQRMLRMESVQKDILDKVEQTLRVEFMSNLARTAKRDAHEQMAEIFNNFDRQTESRFVTALEERSRDSAERIKALMFTFEDLGKLDPGSIQTLLRSIEKDKLGLALKGATDSLRDTFFSNMSERAGKILRDDMEAMGPVRLKDVDEAQMRMVNVAKDLANKGEIMIAGSGSDDELVYSMSQNPRKFTFDTEFHRDRDQPAPEARARQKQTLNVDELEALTSAARREGEESAMARASEALDRTVAALTISLRAALDNSKAEIEAVRAEAATLALAMARKIAPAALEALPVMDVENALRQAMLQAIAEPRITLRAAPQVIAVLEARVNDIAHEEGYDGRVMLAADPHLHGADCRIEWRGGGAERSEAAIEQALAALIAHRFSQNTDTDVKG